MGICAASVNAALRASVEVWVLLSEARVHGGHEHKSGGVVHGIFGARHGDGAVFQRVSQHFQHLPGKLVELVKEQYSVMCQANFAGHGVGASSHQRHSITTRFGGGKKSSLPYMMVQIKYFLKISCRFPPS